MKTSRTGVTGRQGRGLAEWAVGRLAWSGYLLPCVAMLIASVLALLPSGDAAADVGACRVVARRAG